MAKRDNSSFDEIVQSFVDDAVRSMNFDQLNKNITGSIQSVFDELNIDINIESPEQQKKREDYVRYHYGSRKDSGARTGSSGSFRGRKLLWTKNPPGTISGPLKTILGGFLTFGFGISVMLVGLFGIAEGDFVASLAANIVLIPFLILSIWCLVSGIKINKRLSRFRSYIRTFGKRTFCKISELAAAVSKDEDFVIKDIEYMIDKHFFPNGHMDVQKTHLMLDDESYEQYRASQESYESRMAQKKASAVADTPAFSSSGIDDPELVKAIEEGNSYMQKIRRANDAIPDEEITAKLDRMEELIRKIFEVLKKNPDQLPKLRKFMKYYMPTTLKLVNVYQELDAQPVEGENIRNSKAEIAETFDTINFAYEKLLDSFFETAAMDVSSDISVLESMFAQEGLTQNPFE